MSLGQCCRESRYRYGAQMAEVGKFELGNDGPSVILVAIDGSDTSLRAGAYAAGLARRQHAKLVCLFVRSTAIGAGAAFGAMGAYIQTQASIATELREQAETQGGRIGVDIEFVEREGNPYAEIVKLAKEIRADAVIVGASTQAGHRLVGSLAVHLVKSANWPVTVVP
jgi:nucleotide-binding universal stress UspA family protein